MQLSWAARFTFAASGLLLTWPVLFAASWPACRAAHTCSAPAEGPAIAGVGIELLRVGAYLTSRQVLRAGTAVEDAIEDRHTAD
jgi:hypothetical protein